MMIICVPQDARVALIVSAIPYGILVIPDEPTVPDEDVIVALFGLLKLIEYVGPLHTVPLTEISGFTHGMRQVVVAGLVTVTALVQPVPLVAVIVTLVPIAMPVTVLPLIVPEDAVTVAPAETSKATLYFPVAPHTP